jgi:hypothetical protein
VSSYSSPKSTFNVAQGEGATSASTFSPKAKIAMFTTTRPATADLQAVPSARTFDTRPAAQSAGHEAFSAFLDVKVPDLDQAADMYAKLTELTGKLDTLLERYQDAEPATGINRAAALRMSLDDLVDDASLLLAALRGSKGAPGVHC